ncbi:MAG: YraN family protein [Alphaproteobacteria bacterium]
MAEKIAAFYLKINGYKIIKKNYRPKKGIGAGEVDIIVLKDNVLVFVEVKARENEELAAYSILPEQMKRIIRSAEIFLAENPDMAEYDLRFDAVLMGNMQIPVHIKDAFRADF